MSTTTTAAGARPWRLAIIGAVGVLAVGIGATLGSFLLTSRASTLGAAAAYVPADAPFYLELRVLPSSGQDAALRDLLARFPAIEGLDLERPLGTQLGERIDEMLGSSAGGAAPEVSWAQDVAPWFDGRVALALTDATAFDPATMGVDPGEVPFMAFLGVTDKAAAQAAIDTVRDTADAPAFTETQHAGVTIYAPADTAQTFAYALTDDELLVGATADTVARAIDAHADRSASMAGSERIADIAARLPDDWLAFASWDLTDAMSAALDAAASPDPAVADALRQLVEQQPMRGAMAFSAAGDRLALDAVSDAPSGAFAVANEDRGLADEVPSDALCYSEGGNVGPTLAAVIGAVKEAAAASPDGADQVATAESALGVELEDLLSWIDDGALAVGWDGSEAYAGLVLVPSDMDAASRRFGQLSTFARLAALDPSSGIAVGDEDVDGVSVTTITVSNALGASDIGVSELAVQYALTDDRALVGIGDGFVARAIGLDAADSLASVDRFGSAIEAVGSLTNAGMAWLDLAGLRQTMEDAFGPQAEAFGATYETDILPWLEPLDAFVSVSRLEGDHLVQRAALLVD
jgi:hypothetical protein